MNFTKGLQLIFGVIVMVLSVYVVLPNPSFPAPPSDSLQSGEPADVEDTLRRSYFTDFTREEVMAHYLNEFKQYPALRLNYPPEEAQSIIRDQARSTFLEEVVHPFRESVFINGFEPKEAKDVIIISGTQYRQKITVKYIPSNPFLRILFIMLIGFFGIVLISRVVNISNKLLLLSLKILNKK